MQPTTTTPEETAESTTTTSQDTPSNVEKLGEKAKDAADNIKKGAEKVDEVLPDPVDTAVGIPLDALNKAAGELAGTAFGDLANVSLEIGNPAELVIGGLTATVHMIAAFVAFSAIATTVLFLILVPRRKFGKRFTHLSASTAKFLIISSVGVTLAVAMVELSGRLTSSALDVTLPETIDVGNANVYDAALAVVVVPLVEVAFGFQKFFVGVLIAFWPLAAAVSILRSFKHALPIFTSLLVANVAWPPLAALAIGQAFNALPSVGAATWWCLAAVLTAPVANGIALAARSNT